MTYEKKLHWCVKLKVEEVPNQGCKNNPGCSSGDKFESLYSFSLIESISVQVSKLFTAILKFKILVLLSYLCDAYIKHIILNQKSQTLHLLVV